jgi:carbamoyltransferase
MITLGMSGLSDAAAFKKSEFPALANHEYRIVQGLDSAAAIVDKHELRAAIAEERLTGQKGTGAFPVHAIRQCLETAQVPIDRIDHVAHGFSYESHRPFYESSEYTRRQFESVYARDVQIAHLERHFPGAGLAGRFVQVPHHLAHAASAFYPSGFDEALILVADGMGETESVTVAVGSEGKITGLKTIPALHSLGILYGVVTLYLGFEMASDEYKVMGLAPYGRPARYFDTFASFVSLNDDGTLLVPLLARDRSLEEKETHSGVLQFLAETLGPPRSPDAEITQHHQDVAAALQATLQMCLMHVLRHFREMTGQRNLCMAGGVALNCSANGAVNRSRLFRRLFVQPAAGDDGTAIGAALYVQHTRDPQIGMPRSGSPLWGPQYDAASIARTLAERAGCEHRRVESDEQLAEFVASRIAAGEVVAWFQGRAEFGPRALGNRSILADARNPAMRDRLNTLVKERESFRPFAPAVTAEAAGCFFEIAPGDEPAHYDMLLVVPVKAAYRDLLPAVTHVDGSARVQVVHRDNNPRFWMLLNSFGALTGVPVLLNTSFNLRGQPMVCTPEQAVDTFLRSRLDLLVLGDTLVTRSACA